LTVRSSWSSSAAGSALKTKLIIEAILERQPVLTYHPIDISADALIESVARV
jgi:uncharacterized SAM-dependent methyltransferase